MTHIISKFTHWLRKEDDGNSTIEFALFFPMFIVLFISAFEAGLLSIRGILIERALDIAVRDLRLGTWTPPTHTALRQRVCDNAIGIPQCMDTLLLEMQPVSTESWDLLSNNAQCVDRSQTVLPATTFDGGHENNIMLVRACAVFSPIFPQIGLGYHIQKDSTGGYAVIASSAFVNEPR
ncbi:TadE/TadG family type IV pilus assembly protein [Cochlodiniinecator piscidefendens]|uniref:TadE/TadG family type IV pilus assembly protein n=1 Tax=Cochlodiniinecator piscidefendens TaxID=2715756 RepID=UPI001407FEEE|nr:TadE family protein [Cochlodiniinecator piscidefendens]